MNVKYLKQGLAHSWHSVHASCHQEHRLTDENTEAQTGDLINVTWLS